MADSGDFVVDRIGSGLSATGSCAQANHPTAALRTRLMPLDERCVLIHTRGRGRHCAAGGPVLQFEPRWLLMALFGRTNSYDRPPDHRLDDGGSVGGDKGEAPHHKQRAGPPHPPPPPQGIKGAPPREAPPPHTPPPSPPQTPPPPTRNSPPPTLALAAVDGAGHALRLDGSPPAGRHHNGEGSSATPEDLQLSHWSRGIELKFDARYAVTINFSNAPRQPKWTNKQLGTWIITHWQEPMGCYVPVPKPSIFTNGYHTIRQRHADNFSTQTA